MSNDNNNSDSFDFDFDSLNADEPQKQSEESFDLDSPFGDDWTASGNSAEIRADHADLDDSANDSLVEESSVEEPSRISEGEIPPIATEGKKADKKKGFFGRSSKNEAEQSPKAKKEKVKKEKVIKEKKPAGELVPRDWGTILCIAFSVFLLISLLTFNVATFLSRDEGSTLMGTLCFLGAFNLVGLTLVAVPVLFYKFPQERTLPNVMFGISVGAMFTGVLLLVNNFYHYYGFVVSP